jgi:hypothetical protein
MAWRERANAELLTANEPPRGLFEPNDPVFPRRAQRVPRRLTSCVEGPPPGTREHFGEGRRGAGAKSPPQAERCFTPSTGELGHQGAVVAEGVPGRRRALPAVSARNTQPRV